MVIAATDLQRRPARTRRTGALAVGVTLALAAFLAMLVVRGRAEDGSSSVRADASNPGGSAIDGRVAEQFPPRSELQPPAGALSPPMQNLGFAPGVYVYTMAGMIAEISDGDTGEVIVPAGLGEPVRHQMTVLADGSWESVQLTESERPERLEYRDGVFRAWSGDWLRSEEVNSGVGGPSVELSTHGAFFLLSREGAERERAREQGLDAEASAQMVSCAGTTCVHAKSQHGMSTSDAVVARGRPEREDVVYDSVTDLVHYYAVSYGDDIIYEYRLESFTPSE